ncbi:MAG: aminotransferase class I/II-fold pyridoxal phosphate-dependent enzyme [Deltaproteobacteria bacterium]|nr:aminotransferase class I/II-fold pyridoxal phosphate-dependent enzyme [Deltaproteobacteria bacterium]
MEPNLSLNLNVRSLKSSATLAINERSNALIASGRHVIKLGLGQSPFPVPEEVVAALRERAEEKAYLPVAGLWELREAVAGYHRRVDGVAVETEQVVIGPGSKELMFLLQLVFHGELVVPSPCWVSYVPQAKLLGRPVMFVPTTFDEGWRLRPERLAALCAEDPSRPRLMILNYPGNPDGQTYTGDELQAIAAVAREYGIIVLSDEIYGPIYHHTPHVSIAPYYPEGTILSGGLSKWCGAGGWRLGTFAFPPELRRLQDGLTAVASETFTSVSAPIQWAAISAFQGSPAIDDYLVQSRRVLAALGTFCAETLRGAGARLHDPTGAFYLYPDFEPLRDRLAARGIADAETLCARSLDEIGVAFLPGQDFGAGPGALTVRLAYVDFEGREALAAARASADGPLGHDFVREHCARVVEGVEALAAWLN